VGRYASTHWLTDCVWQDSVRKHLSTDEESDTDDDVDDECDENLATTTDEDSTKLMSGEQRNGVNNGPVDGLTDDVKGPRFRYDVDSPYICLLKSENCAALFTVENWIICYFVASRFYQR